MDVREEIAAGEEFLQRGVAAGIVHRYQLIGSAYVGVPAADVDFAVLLESRAQAQLRAFEHSLISDHNFQPCSDYGESAKGEWTSVRRGNLNLMLTTDVNWYDKYLTAMEVCKFLKLADKAARIGVCQIVRDGMKADWLPPVEDDFEAIDETADDLAG